MWGIPKMQSVYTPKVVTRIRGTLGQALQLASTDAPEVNARVLDVIACWRRTEQRLNAPEPKPKYSRHVEKALNGVAGVYISPKASLPVTV